MQTLEDLKSGKLKGIKKLKLSCDLREFPEEILELADSLEILDLTGNNLSELPQSFGRLKKLKIAFFSNNRFTHLPEVLSECSNLDIIGFKANKISGLSEGSLPDKIRWLILTDNVLTSLPDSIGRCVTLQKVMLAGNRLKTLPDSMRNCQNLELLRISANEFENLPEWLFSLPKISWLAFAGNPCSDPHNIPDVLRQIDWKDIVVDKVLGEGASGIISKAHLAKSFDNLEKVAIKVFKGEVTSDGLPQNEMNACIAAGEHPNLVKVLGKIANHPDKKQGLVLELIDPSYKNLGGPPDFQTCTRDTFPDHPAFSTDEIINILSGIASAASQLHSRGIMHGDLYAHNILINKKEFNKDLHPILGDFGAATFYHAEDPQANLIEKIEVRAFGCLMDDLLTRINLKDSTTEEYEVLNQLKADCLKFNANNRPTFRELSKQLKVLKH
jgi:hypothetical protein